MTCTSFGTTLIIGTIPRLSLGAMSCRPLCANHRCGCRSGWSTSRGIIFDDLLLYGQKPIFRKTIISAQIKFNRNEVVLMMLSNIFSKNSTPSIFALPHSKITKTLNFHASYLRLHPHDHPLVFNIASHSCDSSTCNKQSMSARSHRVYSGHE